MLIRLLLLLETAAINNINHNNDDCNDIFCKLWYLGFLLRKDIADSALDSLYR